MGDVILTLPVIQLLAAKFPEDRIDYVTKERYLPLIEHHPRVNRVWTFASGADFGALVSRLRIERFSIYIDLQNNFRSYYLGYRLHGAGILRYKKRRLAREAIVRGIRRSEVEHTVSAYLSPLKGLGIPGEIIPPVLHIPEPPMQYAEDYWRVHDFDKLAVYAICPGARHDEKKWPAAEFRQVAMKILDTPSNGILVFSADTDYVPAGLEIESPRLGAVRDLSLLDTAALLAKCQVAVTNDSGLMHLANAVGTRVVSIFGPTNPRLGFTPTLPGSKVICDDVRCSPCSLHGERKCHQPTKICFEKITARRVYEEILKTQ
jgi:heptosyltransferase-2